MAYGRLLPALSSLITLVELDEIAKRKGRDYFSDSNIQRVILRAFNLIVEESIKTPFEPREEAVYEDYKPFLEGLIKETRSLDSQIVSAGRLPNLIGSLVVIFDRQMNKLRGVERFRLGIEFIRDQIVKYLTELEQIPEGQEEKLIDVIVGRLQTTLE